MIQFLLLLQIFLKTISIFVKREGESGTNKTNKYWEIHTKINYSNKIVVKFYLSEPRKYYLTPS